MLEARRCQERLINKCMRLKIVPSHRRVDCCVPPEYTICCYALHAWHWLGHNFCPPAPDHISKCNRTSPENIPNNCHGPSNLDRGRLRAKKPNSWQRYKPKFKKKNNPGWWFQPLMKNMKVRLDHHPNYWEKKMFQTTNHNNPKYFTNKSNPPTADLSEVPTP